MLSTIQTKIGGGLNKIQDTLQQGKQKMQTVQEASQLRQAIDQLRQKRLESIVEIGNSIHKKVRFGLVHDEDFAGISLQIEQVDKEIYELSKSLEQLQVEASQSNLCSNCKNPAQPNDKFCGSCGNAVNIEIKVEEETKVCLRCNEDIPESAAFCPCCGTVIQG